MSNAIPLYIGFDPREAACFHVFAQSVIERASVPVALHPLHKPMLAGFDGQKDGTNAFIYSRFLVPSLQSWQGFALFADGDMACLDDIARLWELRDPKYAVQVVKHDYRTKYPRKYVGTPMESQNLDYPKKNQSSVMLWNCGHPKNRILTREFVNEAPGSLLHRFEWLRDEEIGELPKEWNWLVSEYEPNDKAKLLHYTLGAPGFAHYSHCDGAAHWHRARKNALHMIGER